MKKGELSLRETEKILHRHAALTGMKCYRVRRSEYRFGDTTNYTQVHREIIGLHNTDNPKSDEIVQAYLRRIVDSVALTLVASAKHEFDGGYEVVRCTGGILWWQQNRSDILSGGARFSIAVLRPLTLLSPADPCEWLIECGLGLIPADSKKTAVRPSRRA